MNLDRILSKYDGLITGPSDMLAGKPASSLFYLLADKLSYLMDVDPEKTISQKGVLRRRKIHPIIKRLGALFMPCPQIIENRNALMAAPGETVPDDPGITLPDEPVIWAANHGFKDDGLATILAVQRHAYLLFGALPQFYNTLDGLTSYLNGLVMFNRKVPASRKSSIPKAVRAMKLGADLVVFPEGIWNKTPNALMLDLWPGVYRIACETGAKVVPVIHYARDLSKLGRDEPIHTVVDDPIRLDDLGERAALRYLRDVLATWTYLMMERYGTDDRETMLGGKTAAEVWEDHLARRVSVVDRYDEEIERSADLRRRDIVRPEDVWGVVAAIQNITPDNVKSVVYARELLTRLEREDFQRRL